LRATAGTWRGLVARGSDPDRSVQDTAPCRSTRARHPSTSACARKQAWKEASRSAATEPIVRRANHCLNLARGCTLEPRHTTSRMLPHVAVRERSCRQLQLGQSIHHRGSYQGLRRRYHCESHCWKFGGVASHEPRKRCLWILPRSPECPIPTSKSSNGVFGCSKGPPRASRPGTRHGGGGGCQRAFLGRLADGLANKQLTTSTVPGTVNRSRFSSKTSLLIQCAWYSTSFSLFMRNVAFDPMCLVQYIVLAFHAKRRF
jgi:hypothetical protein